MAKRVKFVFGSQNGADAAGVVLKKSLGAVGSTKIGINMENKSVEITLEDSSPSKERAAHFGAKRLGKMLSDIDREI